MKDRPEVIERYPITGDADFIKSSFTLREVKHDTALPLRG